MSIRFAIKNTATKAEKESDGTILRYTGVSEPFYRVSNRTGDKVGTDASGNPRFRFVTGLRDSQVNFYNWYNTEEKKAISKQIEELKPLISSYYGGEEVIGENNTFFWRDNRDVSRLSLTNDDIDVFYDTKNPVHALLYLSLVSGAFIDVVGPTKDWAERHQLPHYMVLETEDVFEEEDEITKIEAIGALAGLAKDASPDALFILAWCVQYDTNAFGAYLKSTPMKDLITYHKKYIDGKLVTKKKKNTPKVFLDYVNKWNGQQTRPAVMVEAYVKAGEYYGFLHQKTKKYTTDDGTILGATVDEAVATLLKPKFSSDLEKLRDQVENKWKE